MNDDAESLEAFFAGIRQGDVLSISFDCSQLRGSRWVVISQTCDIVRSKIPTITLARVIVPPENVVDMARDGAMPRFIPLPHLDTEGYADMSDIHSYPKADLLGVEVVSPIAGQDSVDPRSFALAVTRWFGRFPFPDEVVPWLRPLENQIRKKYQKQGALGQVLRDGVVEIRVEADWESKPLELLLHVIVRASILPTVDSLTGSLQPDFLTSLRDANSRVRTPPEIAEILIGTSNPLERAEAFQALAESFASICRPTGSYASESVVKTAVSKVEGLLWADGEFPLSRFRKSEALDLDYLS